MTDYSAYCVEVPMLLREYEQSARVGKWTHAKSVAGRLAVNAIALEVIARGKEDSAAQTVVVLDREPLESPDD